MTTKACQGRRKSVPAALRVYAGLWKRAFRGPYPLGNQRREVEKSFGSSDPAGLQARGHVPQAPQCASAWPQTSLGLASAALPRGSQKGETLASCSCRVLNIVPCRSASPARRGLNAYEIDNVSAEWRVVVFLTYVSRAS